MLSGFRKKRNVIFLVTILGMALSYPSQWYPYNVRLVLTSWFGASAYNPLPESKISQEFSSELSCPGDPSGWRNEQTIDDVYIEESLPCMADNPHAIAAFVLGTNNVSDETLRLSGLAPDAVEKGRDLDGDGDPDEIHIKLEVAELNGSSPISERPITTYDIAPGVQPGLWVFAPKFVGMAVENFDTQVARYSLKIPSPAIRIEQGDIVKVTLENTHYMPHTLHIHGADHEFIDSNGEGNDGVPLTSELPIMPGDSRTYNITPRKAGTMFYHCHVQPHVHVQMGLQGLFIVEENRKNNHLQTMNIGAGKVRVPSKALRESFDSEYDMHYLDLDKELGVRIQQHNDPRLITKSMHRDYDITDANVDYFTLNGRSFPFTFRESLVIAKANKKAKLRVVNGGSKGIALHTHGHKFTVLERDGVQINESNQTPQDVLWLPTSQRYDLELSFINDGQHAYGPGIWLFHDHQNKGITTDGIGPGGNISAIVYEEYLDEFGWPLTRGVDYTQYFSVDYYKKQLPIWGSYAPSLFSEPGRDVALLIRVLLFALFFGVFLANLRLIFSKERNR
jgi:FtsP/CotA-like multicopper oxidase with cupredoxin domain